MKHCEVKLTHAMQNARSYGQATKTLDIYIYIYLASISKGLNFGGQQVVGNIKF